MKPLLFLMTLSVAGVCAGDALAQRVSDLPSSQKAAASSEAPRFSRPAQEAAPLANGIIAVVNDSVISVSDLRARMGLVLLSSGSQPSPEVQKRLMPQVMRSLVDEQLQLQEGKKANISVSENEVNEALKRLSEDNKIPGGDIEAFLRSQGISPQTLRTQARATLTWNKVIGREIRPRIDIGEEDINAAIQRLRASTGKPEYLLSEVFLAVDKPEDDEQVKALADKLVDQIKSGSVFGGIARQFSQGLGAANGGDIGWIHEGQLAPEIDKVLSSMEKGSIAGPVRSSEGYHIMGLREKRTISLGDPKDMTVSLRQIFKPFSASIDKETLLMEAGAIKENIVSCDQLQETLARQYPDWKYQDLGSVVLRTAPSWLAEKVINLPVGEASEALATDKGALMLFVCDRTVPEKIDRDVIINSLGTEKMEMMARRLLRDLRKNAYIDFRLKDIP